MSVAWSSAGLGGSVVPRHERKGLSKIRGVLEDFVEKSLLQSQEQYSTGPRSIDAGSSRPRVSDEEDD